MSQLDTRKLSPQVQEEIRVRVVKAIRAGMRKSAAARTFGVSRTSIDTWLAKVECGNITSLRSKKRGRPPEPRLASHQAATIVRLITDRCPDQLKLPFALWTREAVRDLIAQRTGLQVSVRTAGRYLKRWGFTPQKPLRRAYERDPAAVERWKREEYPAIARRARAEHAEIHWADQLGARSDHQAGRSYGRRGRTPVIPGTGQRFRANMMSSITNRGHLCFLVFDGSFNAEVFIRFCRRLLRQRRRRIFLIVDGHPVHRSAAVRDWLQANRRRIRMFFLPGYSPELNPDEYLNNDVKTNAIGRQRPATKDELILNLEQYLRDTQRRPHIVRNYFKAEPIQYAAG
ncbi:MAG: IS630 family transposase [Phycisphaerales bacterium]|nr:IS630 family transposase [Phycisphaerales bacterium]